VERKGGLPPVPSLIEKEKILREKFEKEKLERENFEREKFEKEKKIEKEKSEREKREKGKEQKEQKRSPPPPPPLPPLTPPSPSIEGKGERDKHGEKETFYKKGKSKNLKDLREKKIFSFKSVIDQDFREKAEWKRELLKQLEDDIKLDHEFRTNPEHNACACHKSQIWWQRGRKGGVANPSGRNLTHPVDTLLHVIPEGVEEEEHAVRASVVIVVGSGTFNGGQSNVRSEGPTGPNTGGNNGVTPRGFLSKREEKGEIIGYLDSGANEHMFNSKHVFKNLKEEKSNVITACENGKINMAQVGDTKQLFYKNGEKKKFSHKRK
jgi:hypothetical protein